MSLLKSLSRLARSLNPEAVDAKAVAAVVDSNKLKSGLTLLDGSMLQVRFHGITCHMVLRGTKAVFISALVSPEGTGSSVPASSSGLNTHRHLPGDPGAWGGQHAQTISPQHGYYHYLPRVHVQAGVIHASGYKLMGTDHLGNKYYQRGATDTQVRTALRESW